MTAASRYVDHMHTIWPRWEAEPFRHYGDDGDGGEPGLESRLGAWRDAFLAERFPVAAERNTISIRDKGTFRLGRDRLRILMYLFCPFVYGRDWGGLNRDRLRRVALIPQDARVDQEARVGTFLAHLENLQNQFNTLATSPHPAAFHDPALLVSIALHEGAVTDAFTSTSNRRFSDMPFLLQARPLARGMPDVVRRVLREGNVHTFGQSGLDHVGPLIDDFRRWGWIPPEYDNDGGQPTWLYEQAPDTPMPGAAAEGYRRHRAILAGCYPGNAFDNYHFRENKCYQAAVLPSGEILVALALYLWRASNLIESTLQTLFPGERFADLPTFFRRLVTVFTFGSSSQQTGTSVRREAVLQRRLRRVMANRPTGQASLPQNKMTAGQLLRFLKDSAGSRTAVATAADPAFYSELYAHFAYGHTIPRNRFWRAYVAALLDEAQVLSAPPAPP